MEDGKERRQGGWRREDSDGLRFNALLQFQWILATKEHKERRDKSLCCFSCDFFNAIGWNHAIQRRS